MRTLVSCPLPLKTITLTVALFAAGIAVAQDTSRVKPAPAHTRRPVAKKKSASKPKTAARPVATSKAAARGRSSKSSKTKKPVAARRSTQQQPTPERYKEIQQALAGHGYFNGAVDGNWGADSIESLKRFQRDQNLTDDGKLGSLSLIALGLGPKRPDANVDKPTQQ